LQVLILATKSTRAGRQLFCNLGQILKVKKFAGIVCLLLGVIISTQAAHLVGGEISYQCLGNQNYRIKLVVYRDCASLGAAFDNPAAITIFNGTSQYLNLDVNLAGRGSLPVSAPNSCTTLPPFVCTEKGVYIDTVQLPASALGYTISYQRCCRNSSISNIPNPGNQGNTFTIDVPPNDFSCNSSPDFTTDPPVALCLNVYSSIDMSTSEIDGDSVVYSLCRLYNGGGPNTTNVAPGALNSPAPDPAAPPPYSFIPFANGFSPNNPISSAPAFSIDPQTGILTGTPSQVGQYVFAICATEYRNGVLLSTVRRDFQFNVTSACRRIRSIISGQAVDSSTLCTGRTVTFSQNSQNATTYFWDFGDPLLNNDTSNLANPTYTYRDTGVYQVMLIADPGQSCSDTSYSLYRIYNPIDANFTFNEEVCFEDHMFDFRVNGTYSDSARFYWSFGGSTNLGDSSRVEEPLNVQYFQPGTYVVSLFVDDYKCFARHQDTIRLFPRIDLGQTLSETTGCAPLTVTFTDDSDFLGTARHYWDFGDGTFSTDRSTQHTYNEPGIYSITHRIITAEGCIDTAEIIMQNQVEVYPVPQANLSVNPQVTDIYHPRVTLQDSSIGSSQSQTFLPGGAILENLENDSYTFTDTGNFEIKHIVYNQYGCSDTAFLTVRIEQPVNFFIPSAFTPNGDGINDVFRFVATGVSQLEIQIFNRWGERVFISNSSQAVWDGNDAETGEPLPGGVYTYILIGRVTESGVDEKRSGTIKLLR